MSFSGWMLKTVIMIRPTILARSLPPLFCTYLLLHSSPEFSCHLHKWFLTGSLSLNRSVKISSPKKFKLSTAQIKIQNCFPKAQLSTANKTALSNRPFQGLRRGRGRHPSRFNSRKICQHLTNWQDGISAIKFEAARIHFLRVTFSSTSAQLGGFVSLRMTASFLNQCNIKQIFAEI